MASKTRTGLVDWDASREKGSGVYRLRCYDTISGNPIELELTGIQLFSLARFLPGLIERDAAFFADYKVTLTAPRGVPASR